MLLLPLHATILAHARLFASSVVVARLWRRALALAVFVDRGEKRISRQEAVARHDAAAAGNARRQACVCEQVDAACSVGKAPAKLHGVHAASADVEPTRIHGNRRLVGQQFDWDRRPNVAANRPLHGPGLPRICSRHLACPVPRLWMWLVHPRQASAVTRISRADVSQRRIRHRTRSRRLGWVPVLRVRRWERRDGSLSPRDRNSVALEQRSVETERDRVRCLVVRAAGEGGPCHSAIAAVVERHQACCESSADWLLESRM